VFLNFVAISFMVILRAAPHTASINMELGKKKIKIREIHGLIIT
jgi:hypothetical protein